MGGRAFSNPPLKGGNTLSFICKKIKINNRLITFPLTKKKKKKTNLLSPNFFKSQSSELECFSQLRNIFNSLTIVFLEKERGRGRGKRRGRKRNRVRRKKKKKEKTNKQIKEPEEHKQHSVQQEQPPPPPPSSLSSLSTTPPSPLLPPKQQQLPPRGFQSLFFVVK